MFFVGDTESIPYTFVTCGLREWRVQPTRSWYLDGKLCKSLYIKADEKPEKKPPFLPDLGPVYTKWSAADETYCPFTDALDRIVQKLEINPLRYVLVRDQKKGAELVVEGVSSGQLILKAAKLLYKPENPRGRSSTRRKSARKIPLKKVVDPG
jgi:hypothetical protein